MEWQSVSRVRVLEELPLAGVTRCLRLLLESDEAPAIIPGQYCLLQSDEQPARAFTYVSLPGRDRRFIVASSQPGPSPGVGQRLRYRGPFGAGWPLPLGASRLLVFACDGGLLAVAAALDEFACWMPWVHLDLVHDPASQACLPEDCRLWLQSLGLLAATRRDTCPLERLRAQLDAAPPDLVYCAAPTALAQRAARMCLWHGVPAYRIWLRDERCLPAAGTGPTPLSPGPVLRLDRLRECI
ncbi:hypothetical protein [Pseudomonas citronellolis]|uniref:hypothetical protein n=1 Tax=Pseudomonas citronellolis TaxID=53408 RepID=UPI0023E40C33|nr:hypothetical protein [Pseudomonas citronellolis]MDF3933678.1 hypothetical protein [Pseudomonas citronellolis]